ncbi:MAG: hypothetical protein R3B57_03225 [Phycisphaerales bacterium]
MTPTTTLARRRRSLLACVGTLLLVAPALGAPPDSLSFATPEAPLIISIRDVGKLADRVASMVGDLGLPGDVAMGPQLAQMMLMTPGLNKNGSATLVLYPPNDEHFQMQGVVIAPVSDYAQLMSVVGGDASADVASFEIQGAPAFARDLGRGYAAIGPEHDFVASYKPGADVLQRQNDRLGVVGGRVAETADIVIIAAPEIMAMVLHEGAGLAQNTVQDQAGAFGFGDAVDQMGGAVGQGIERFLADARVGVVGLTLDDAGIALDLAAQFNDDSPLAGEFSHAGHSAEMVGKLPSTGYWLAWSVDAGAPGLGELTKMLTAAAGMGDDAGEAATGMAGVIGASPAVLQTGVLSRTALYLRTEHGEQLAGAIGDAVKKLDGTSGGGMAYHTTFEPGAKQIEGASVAAYSVQTEMTPPDEENEEAFNPALAFMPDPQVINQVMFGPTTSGPSGYVAVTPGGVVQTFSRSDSFMSAALTAAGGGKSLAGDARLGQSSALLPEGRSFEAYLALDTVAQTAVPMLMLAGLIPEAPEVGAMPPVALGVTTDAGGFRARLVVPKDVISVIAKFAAPFMPAAGGGDDWDQDWDNDGGDENDGMDDGG